MTTDLQKARDLGKDKNLPANKTIYIRCNAKDHATIVAAAGRAGMTVNLFCLATLLKESTRGQDNSED